MNGKIYFPGLNTLRFFAALVVVIDHVEQMKALSSLPNIWDGAIWGMAYSGVALFFVLSGFLITYLLLAEQEKHGRIDIKKFYSRRVLRIWPLYYLIVVFSFFVLPYLVNFENSNQALQQNFWAKLLLFVLILPNVANAVYQPVLGASQAWSIGVEEQFYLIWPILLRRFMKVLMPLFLVIIFLKMVTLRGTYFLVSRGEMAGWGESPIDGLQAIGHVLTTFRIENLTMGAIGAFLIFHKRLDLFKPMRWLLHPASQPVYLIVAVLLSSHRDWFLHGILEAVVFTLLIVNVAYNGRLWLISDKTILNYWGTISYGIYMIHPAVIALSLAGLKRFPDIGDNLLFFNILLYILTVGGTIVLSDLCYRFWEAPFLKLKNRLAVVKSGGTAAVESTTP